MCTRGLPGAGPEEIAVMHPLVLQAWLRFSRQEGDYWGADFMALRALSFEALNAIQAGSPREWAEAFAAKS